MKDAKSDLFTYSDALRYGWNLFRQHTGLIIMILMIIVFVQIILGTLGNFIDQRRLEPQAFEHVVDEPAALFAHLIQKKYVEKDGEITEMFEVMPESKFSLSSEFSNQKQEVYQIIRRESDRFDVRSVVAIMFDIAVWVIGGILILGAIGILLRLMDGKSASKEELLNESDQIFTYLLAKVCYYLVTFLGFLLLIVPGIIWSIKYQFYPMLIVERQLGPIQALKESGRITKGSKGKLFVLSIILGAVNFLGLLCLGIGLLVTIPMTYIAQLYVYRCLVENQPSIDELD